MKNLKSIIKAALCSAFLAVTVFVAGQADTATEDKPDLTISVCSEVCLDCSLSDGGH